GAARRCRHRLPRRPLRALQWPVDRARARLAAAAAHGRGRTGGRRRAVATDAVHGRGGRRTVPGSWHDGRGRAPRRVAPVATLRTLPAQREYATRSRAPAHRTAAAPARRAAGGLPRTGRPLPGSLAAAPAAVVRTHAARLAVIVRQSRPAGA